MPALVAGIHVFPLFVAESKTSDLVAEAGRLLYGAQWATPLTKALRVDRRQLRLWMAANPASNLSASA
jgi:hypothetical protein